MSQHCLQVQIANYLYGHSDKFTDLYGPAYALMLGDCLGPFNGSDKHCKNCPMHPGFCDSVTNEELDELIFIADNLRTDESHRFFGNVANHLLMKGLIEKFGTSVRVTPHGRAKIGLAINGGDTKQANRTDGSSND